jgi:drug/metabolite transporter (DMT)-like permease
LKIYIKKKYYKRFDPDFLFLTFFFCLLFFSLSLAALFGWDHFYDAFRPQVIGWTFLWSGLYISLGNVFWFNGLKYSKPTEISIIGGSYLPLSLFFTAILLQTVPTSGEIVGSIIILMSIVYS